MSEKAPKSKPPITQRLYGWGAKRLRHPALGEISRGAVKEAGKGAFSALKPQPLDQEEIAGGFRGRYADGGATRFRDMMAELQISEEDLETLDAFHRLQRFLNAFAALVAFLIGLALIIFGDLALTKLGGGAFLIFLLVFLAGYIRHDFALWQVTERKMAGLSDYLSRRFGSAVR